VNDIIKGDRELAKTLTWEVAGYLGVCWSAISKAIHDLESRLEKWIFSSSSPWMRFYALLGEDMLPRRVWIGEVLWGALRLHLNQPPFWKDPPLWFWARKPVIKRLRIFGRILLTR
jgi:hypothetical protein